MNNEQIQAPVLIPLVQTLKIPFLRTSFGLLAYYAEQEKTFNLLENVYFKFLRHWTILFILKKI